jgi:hypothetical protein
MIKVILIPFELTADLFGCDPDHFRQHVRGKLLKVKSETAHFITVEDATDETWTVNKNDLGPKQDDEEFMRIGKSDWATVIKKTFEA